MTAPETSIVIRTFNEERHLPRLLEAIHEQRYDDFEVINVDSGSYDRTTEIAREHGARLRSISSQDFTFGYSLNVGVEAAAGRFVVLVSAHTVPYDDQWLENLVGPLRQESVAMAYGRQYGVASSKFGETRDLARTFGPERKVLTPPHYFANNANSAFLRELWTSHPFSEDLPGQEDVEWAKHWMDRGYKVIYEPNAGIYHIHDETWRQVKRRYYGEAVAHREIGVWRPRDAASLAASEAWRLAGDSVAALRSGRLFSLAPEIFRFRAMKGYGTISGLLNGKAVSTPSGRQSLHFDRKCKAVVISGPNQASLQEVDIPPVRPGDVLVQVAYGGVTAADLGVLTADQSFRNGDAMSYPVIPGGEVSGWVARAGANVAGLQEGDRVVVQSLRGCGECGPCRDSTPLRCQTRDGATAGVAAGSYSEYLAAPGVFAHKLPPALGLKTAVLAEALAVVLRGLRRVGRFLGKEGGPPTFAVIGAGPIGHLCALVLSSKEIPVTVFDRNPKRLESFEGAAVSVGSDSSRLEQYDVVVEATGDPDSLEQVIRTSNPDAVHLLLGLPASGRRFVAEGRAAGEKAVIWSAGADGADFQEAAELLPRLPLADSWYEAVPLTEFQRAWESFRRGDHLKVLVEVSPDRAGG